MGHLSGDAELLASELVANAAEHGDGKPISIIVRRHAEPGGHPGITCEVTDSAPQLPQRPVAGPDAERGRGWRSSPRWPNPAACAPARPARPAGPPSPSPGRAHRIAQQIDPEPEKAGTRSATPSAWSPAPTPTRPERPAPRPPTPTRRAPGSRSTLAAQILPLDLPDLRAGDQRPGCLRRPGRRRAGPRRRLRPADRITRRVGCRRGMPGPGQLADLPLLTVIARRTRPENLPDCGTLPYMAAVGLSPVSAARQPNPAPRH